MGFLGTLDNQNAVLTETNSTLVASITGTGILKTAFFRMNGGTSITANCKIQIEVDGNIIVPFSYFGRIFPVAGGLLTVDMADFWVVKFDNTNYDYMYVWKANIPFQNNIKITIQYPVGSATTDNIDTTITLKGILEV